MSSKSDTSTYPLSISCGTTVMVREQQAGTSESTSRSSPEAIHQHLSVAASERHGHAIQNMRTTVDKKRA